MKILVTYKSKTEFTKRYAEIIAKEVQGDLVDFSKVTSEKMSEYDNVIEYPSYYSEEQLTIINILKKVTYNPESLTNQEILLLIKFFKNRKLVEDILSSSGNGLKLNKRSLSIVIKLFEDKTPTTGKNIKNYESLCTKLSLTKKEINKLEKKIA